MLSDLMWTLILCVLAMYGLKKPFVAMCVVIFVDTLKPQQLSYSFLAGQPLSLAFTAILFASIAINIKDIRVPKKAGLTFLLLFFIGWITYTTNIAQFQDNAWFKYDYVVKTIILTVFIPFVINTRAKLDAFIGVLICGIAYYVLIGGIRTALGQASYGTLLIQTPMGDSGIVETSSLSMVAVFTIPLLFYLKNHSIFKDKIPGLNLICWLLIVCCALTTIGTYARTGIVGFSVLFFIYALRSKYKFRIFSAATLLGISILLFAPESYLSRMSTISNAEEEGSALGRILVWKWTIDYVKDRPLTGGGFDSYLANKGEFSEYNQSATIVSDDRAKAFHNIFFEVLGEQGYVGLFLYSMIIFKVLWLSLQVSRSTRNLSWQRNFANTLIVVLFIYCACGMFIGVAYSPWLFYFLGLVSSLQNTIQEKSVNGFYRRHKTRYQTAGELDKQ